MHAEIDRDVVEGRDLVHSRPFREQATIPRIDHLLRGEEALPLHKGPLDLPNVDHGIEACPTIVNDIRPEHGVVPSQAINLDLRDRHPVGEIMKRLPVELVDAAGVLIPSLDWGLVVPLSGQIHPLHPGVLSSGSQGRNLLLVLHRPGWPVLLQEWLQPLHDHIGRDLRRVAVDIRARRGRRSHRVRTLVRRCIRNVDCGQGNVKASRDHLSDLRV
mmetsp:Transcript_36343/g.79355  ORF Transcript_36343/g.79355 Transcript_36343/m.79355 type:complete len:216 (-) Transcript_36343:843-1490(-)